MGNYQYMKVSILLLLLAVLFTATATAIVVDGDMTDWGIQALNDPSSDWSKESTWVPSIPGILFVVEDNNNPQHVGTPGFQTPGVHIMGSKASYSFYDEPVGLLNGTSPPIMITEPWGGEPYDLEAYYVTNDPTTIYVGIITSLQQSGIGDSRPGDLALNFMSVAGEEFNCEYGVKLSSPSSPADYSVGDIVYLPDWEGTGYVKPFRADVMLVPPLNGGGVLATKATVRYVPMAHDDNGAPNYFIEVAIPKSAVGVNFNAGLTNIQLNDNCQNDHIFIPEFPTFAISLGIIGGIIFMICRMKNKIN